MNSSSSLPSEKPIYDVLVLGGGPAGLSAALLLGRACRQVALLDSGRQRNSCAVAMHGFLGRDGTLPRALLEDGRRELAQYGVDFFSDCVQQAEKLKTQDQAFETAFRLSGESGRTWLGRKLLIATGMKDEIPELPGLRDCYGMTVHHCPYCDGWEKRGRHLLAFGLDAEKAAGMGLLLRGWSDQITVLTNGECLDDEYREQLSRLGIKLCEERALEVVHEHGQLRGVAVENCGLIAADALFFNTDEHPHSALAQSLGVIFSESGASRTNRKQKTNVPGLYIAGDAAGNIQMAIVAAGEGATAAVALNRELQEEDRELGVGYPDPTAAVLAKAMNMQVSETQERRSA